MRFRGLGAVPPELEVLAVTTRENYIRAIEQSKHARTLSTPAAIATQCRGATEALARARYLQGRLVCGAEAVGIPVASSDRPAAAQEAVMACWGFAIDVAANPLHATRF